MKLPLFGFLAMILGIAVALSEYSWNRSWVVWLVVLWTCIWAYLMAKYHDQMRKEYAITKRRFY